MEPVAVSPEMIEAGYDAAKVFLLGATPGEISAAVVAAYQVMRAVEPHSLAEWHAWVKENVPEGTWPKGPFR